MFSNDSVVKARKAFFEEFEKKTGEAVVNVEFVSFRAEKKVYEMFRLKPSLGEDDMSGLIVFCEKSLYFYSFPTDNYFRLMLQQIAGNQKNEEQSFRLSDLSSVELSCMKTKWYSFLFPEQSRTLNVRGNYCGLDADFSLIFMKKATLVLEQMKKYF